MCAVLMSDRKHYMTSQILLILIDFDSLSATFGSKTTRYNSGTGKDIEKRQTVILLIFAALSNSVIKHISFALSLDFVSFSSDPHPNKLT